MGGAEAIVTNYAIQMKKKGIDVAVLVVWHYNTVLYQKLRKIGIPVFKIYNNSNYLYKVANRINIFKLSVNAQIYKTIEDYKPDVVHLNTFLHNIQINKKICSKWFFTLHTDLNRFLSQFQRNGISNFSNQLTKGLHVICLTDKAKQDVLAFNPYANVTVIPNGIDIDEIQAHKCDKKQLLKELNLPDNTFILGHVGRFYKVKNHEKLIDVFNCIHKQKKQSALLLVGDGSKVEKERIHDLVEKYSLQDCVKFLRVRTDATALMSCFDAFALPSFQESFSLVLVEAQAQSVRCVASDTVPDEVICNDNCFKLSINEPSEKWADLLLGSNVRQGNVSSVYEFDINRVLANTIALYKL